MIVLYSIIGLIGASMVIHEHFFNKHSVPPMPLWASIIMWIISLVVILGELI